MSKKLQLYERVPKNSGFPTGEDTIEEDDFLTRGPVLLCVSAQDDPKSVFGITKFGMNVVGIQVRDFNPEGYNLDGFPALFCSIKLENSKEDTSKEDEFQQFYDDYFKCVVEENSQRRNVDDVAKSLRNLNIIGYCNGNERIEKIIQALKTNMNKIGYSKEEIDYAISQIGLVTLATDCDTRKIGCTVVDFHDMKDREVSGKFMHSETGKRLEENETTLEGFQVIDERRVEYALINSDEHSMKHYFKDGVATPACLKKVVSNLLISSINASKGSFKPLTPEQMVEGCAELIQQAKSGKSKDEILKSADDTIKFDGARKISKDESNLLRALEMTCDSIVSLRNTNKSLKGNNEILSEKLDKMDDAVGEMCSEETAKKIRCSAGLWQYSSEEERKKLQGIPTDKQTIEKQRFMLKTVLGFADKVRKSPFGKIFFGKEIKKLPPAQDDKEI